MRRHARYGLLIRSSDGEEGFVDSDHIADRPLRPEDWPPVGERLSGVVLGYTQVGRVRLSTAPSYVAMARATDMTAAMRSWQDIRAADDRYLAAVREFLSGPHAEPVLRWALTGPYHAADRAAAVRLVAAAGERLRARLPTELLRMALDDDQRDE